MSVPLPTPEGPVITITLGIGSGPRARPVSAPPHELDELAPLALGQTANGLARRDLALREDFVDFHPTVFRYGEQKVENLGGFQVVRGPKQQLLDRLPAALEVALQLGAP